MVVSGVFDHACGYSVVKPLPIHGCPHARKPGSATTVVGAIVGAMVGVGATVGTSVGAAVGVGATVGMAVGAVVAAGSTPPCAVGDVPCVLIAYSVATPTTLSSRTTRKTLKIISATLLFGFCGGVGKPR